ncbi:MAG: 4Fe-4S binding protein [Chloroflexi bacterium]|nr:4Fe-4S binding protein [Chloroflexota bacterium]
MRAKVLRKIVRIDEEKCDGCGLCVPACAEGAIAVVDGKAHIANESHCDGLGVCLGECPQGAISIEERLAEKHEEAHIGHATPQTGADSPVLPCGCPSASVTQFADRSVWDVRDVVSATPAKSELAHWPVQLALIPPGAPFLSGADLLLAADCVPFAYASFHESLLQGHALLVACPKLDDFQAHLTKLTQILRLSPVRSITVTRIGVGCCRALTLMAQQAIDGSGRAVPLREMVISTRGEVLDL